MNRKLGSQEGKYRSRAALLVALACSAALSSGPTNAAPGPQERGPVREEIVPLYWGVIFGLCAYEREKPGCEKIEALIRSDRYTVRRCTYGPAGNSRTYSFWAAQVPEDIWGYTVKGSQHPFTILGTRPVQSCPPPEKIESVFQATRLSAEIGADLKRVSSD